MLHITVFVGIFFSKASLYDINTCIEFHMCIFKESITPAGIREDPHRQSWGDSMQSYPHL